MTTVGQERARLQQAVDTAGQAVAANPQNATAQAASQAAITALGNFNTAHAGRQAGRGCTRQRQKDADH